MSKQNINSFIIDIEKLINSVNDKDIKEHLSKEFENLKERHFPEKEKKKINVYEEIKKLMYDNRGETAEVVPIDMEEFKTVCNDNVRIKRINLVNQKIKHMEGEPIMIAYLKGYLLKKHKDAIGVKNFITFLADTNENYDYSTFLIKLYKLIEKYKGLQRCRISVRVFKAKFAIIKEICNNNPKDWEG